jgi:hypothetical protein
VIDLSNYVGVGARLVLSQANAPELAAAGGTTCSYAFQMQRTLVVHFSATVCREPEVDVALV